MFFVVFYVDNKIYLYIFQHRIYYDLYFFKNMIWINAARAQLERCTYNLLVVCGCVQMGSRGRGGGTIHIIV